METQQFDAWTRSLLARRPVLRILSLGAVATVLSGGVKQAAGAAATCVAVKKRCRRASQCCSGVCRGPNGRKTCRAHDVDTCRLAHDRCEFGTGAPLCAGDAQCVCLVTTGGAPYCGAAVQCDAECERDSDCAGVTGEGAACVKVQGPDCCAGLVGNRCAIPCFA